MRTSNTEISTTKFQENADRAFQVRYIQDLSLVTVKGWSITPDIHSKYGQLLIDIENHFNTSNSLNIHFRYELFNSSSVKYLFTIIKMMNVAYSDGKDVKIYWSCDSENEDEMLETGMDLHGMCDFNFDISYS